MSERRKPDGHKKLPWSIHPWRQDEDGWMIDHQGREDPHGDDPDLNYDVDDDSNKLTIQ